MATLWLGLEFLPGTHPSLQVPLILALALFGAIGGELPLWQQREEGSRGLRGTGWILPSAVVLAAGAATLFRLYSPREIALAGAVLSGLAILLQLIEANGPTSLRPIAHAASIALAFALGFFLALVLPTSPALWAVLIWAFATGMLTLVVVRGRTTSMRDLVLAVTVTAIATAQIAAVLVAAQVAPATRAVVLVVGLYAASTTVASILSRSSRRSYLEVAAVMTAIALILLLSR